MPPLSLQPNPQPSSKLPHIPQRKQGVCVFEREISSSRHRGGDLRLRDLQLFGRPSLPVQGVPTSELELVEDVDGDEEEDLGSALVTTHHMSCPLLIGEFPGAENGELGEARTAI